MADTTDTPNVDEGESQEDHIIVPEIDMPQPGPEDAAPSTQPDADEPGDAPEGEESDKGQEKADEETGKEAEQPKPDKEAARQGYIVRQARREAREAREALEDIRAEVAKLREGKDEAIPTEMPKPPNPDKFKFGIDDDDFVKAQLKYQEDRDAYILAQAEDRAFKRAEEAQRSAQQAAETRTLQTKIQEIEEKGVEKYSDFTQVVEDAFSAMQPDMAALRSLAMQDGAEDVVYHLASNPEQLARITDMEPMAQAFEMGRLASQFTAKRNIAEKTTTKAKPTPTQPRGASGRFASSEDALYDKLLNAYKT